MRTDLSWRSIAGFRLVTQAPERTAAFYAALGFTTGATAAIAADEMALLGLFGRGERQTMRAGGVRVDLDCYDEVGASYPPDTAASAPLFQHLALVTSDIAAAWRRALAAGATPIGAGEPVTLPAASGGVTAIKFRDPEGHPLELIAFPDGAARGDAGGGLLGIDHSAIVVADLPTALAFFADVGLREGVRTLNVGSEQDRLDGVAQAHVDVVPLAPPTPTPHLELLHYRSAAASSHAPPMANDVAATRIVWRAGRDALVRDPGGHLHQLVR